MCMGVFGPEPQNNGHLLTPDNRQEDLHELILNFDPISVIGHTLCVGNSWLAWVTDSCSKAFTVQQWWYSYFPRIAILLKCWYRYVKEQLTLPLSSLEPRWSAAPFWAQDSCVHTSHAHHLIFLRVTLLTVFTYIHAAMGCAECSYWPMIERVYNLPSR